MASERHRTIAIETASGRVRVRVVYIYSGLAVHRMQRLAPRPHGWAVTHMPSGRIVLRSATKEGAFTLARQISKWANWKQPAETLVRNLRLGRRIKQLSRESKESTWAYV